MVSHGGVLTPAGLEPHADASCPGPLCGYAAWGWGASPRAQPTNHRGTQGSSPQNDCTTGRAGGDWEGRTPPDQRRHSAGPGRLDLAPAPGRRDRPTETRGDRLGRTGLGVSAVRAGRPASNDGPREEAGARPVASGWKEVVPEGR
jgi:hypothetical protein